MPSADRLDRPAADEAILADGHGQRQALPGRDQAKTISSQLGEADRRFLRADFSRLDEASKAEIDQVPTPIARDGGRPAQDVGHGAHR